MSESKKAKKTTKASNILVTDISADNIAEAMPATADFESILKLHLNKTEAKLTQELKQVEENIRNSFKTQIDSLKTEITRQQNEIEEIRLTCDNTKKQAELSKAEYDKLKQENSQLKAKVGNCEQEQSNLTELIEDRTNRQLRKTLVFRGVPEKQYPVAPSTGSSQQQPRLRPENYDDTEELIAQLCAETCDVPLDRAKSMLERVHRAAEKQDYKGRGPRPIFAAFYDWKDSEFVQDKFRARGRSNPDFKMYADQKYGPRTSARRNMAMIERKKLKEANQIISGYVKFPAKLMVKKSNSPGSKYHLHRDFSRDAIQLRI